MSKKPKKNRRQKKLRSLVVLGMILTRKGGKMRDKRKKREKQRNQRETVQSLD